MDLFVVQNNGDFKKVIEKFIYVKELFQSKQVLPEDQVIYMECQSCDIIMMFISLFLGFYAGYLSWCRNSSNKKMPILLRLLYALTAFMFGGTYLIIYFVFLQGSCKI